MHQYWSISTISASFDRQLCEQNPDRAREGTNVSRKQTIENIAFFNNNRLERCLFNASYSAHLRSNANGKSEKQSVHTWTLVALRPATEAICWVAANIVFISGCKSVREWGIERAFRKFIRKRMDFFFSSREIFLSALREKRRRLPLYLEGILKKKYAQAKKRKRWCVFYGNKWISSRQRICTLMTWLKRITAIYILPKRKTFFTDFSSLSLFSRVRE